MKTLTSIIAILMLAGATMAQQNQLPDVKLKNLDGHTVSLNELADSGSATVIVFWKTTDNKCCDNLESLQEVYEETLGGVEVNIISICVDATGTWSHIKPYVNAKGYDFETYVDTNGELKRAMNVGNMPCTIVYDQMNNQLCRYDDFCAGYTDMLCGKIYGQAMAAAGE
jgi:peroxiredoxin